MIADGASIRGDIHLSDGFNASGTVRFLDARIGGIFTCRGGTFTNSAATRDANCEALHADRIDVRGSVFLTDGFLAKGEVRFLGAKVGGMFACRGGTFSHPEALSDQEAKALSTDGMYVRGDVFLTDGFRASGEVRFLGVKVGGQFCCRSGTFIHPAAASNSNAVALHADGIFVRGDVFLTEEFNASGQVRFVGAKIGGQLNCRGGAFTNAAAVGGEDAVALNLENVEVGEVVLLDDGFHARGRAVFDGAQLNRGLSCRGRSDTPIRMDTLELRGASVKGALTLEHCQFERMLDLRFASVQTFDDREAAWPARGQLDIERFRYETLSPESPRDFESRLRWLQLQTTFHPQPYRQLAATLATMGQDEDAREVHIALAQRQHEDERAKRFWELRRSTIWWLRLILKWGLGYGYLPWRPIWAMLGLLLLGWGIFTFGHPHLFSPASDEVLLSEAYRTTGAAPAGYQRFSAFVYSADVLLPIIDFHQETAWLPDSTKHVDLWGVISVDGAWLRWYFWFHIAMGWILTTLLVVGLTGIVRHRVEEE